MKRYSVLLLAGVATFALQAKAAAAEDVWKDWTIDGYNTLRMDYYDIEGDKTSSPFAFGGDQMFNEFNVNASRQISPYERFRGSVLGVVNDSDYRTTDNGFVPERVNLFYEKGDASVPFRVEAGDYFAGVSYRTLQRTLKGASVELQPYSTPERKHSFLVFTGANQPTYRTGDANDDYYTGASWLMEDRDLGQVSLNMINARQDETTPTLAGADNSQMTYSAAIEKLFNLLKQKLVFEGELALFDGDYAATKDKTDTGTFAQVSGRSDDEPLDYRLRFERYGTDYRPNGAIITPDRRSFEGHAGWRFESGTYLRGRLQRFEDSFDSTNQSDTDVAGLNLSGPVLANYVSNVTSNIDLFRQRIQDDFSTIDQYSDTLDATLNKPIYEDISGQFNLFLQRTNDRLAANTDNSIRQVGVGVYKPISIAGLSGTFNPGVALRKVDSNITSDSREFQPTLNISLANEEHRISANYGLLRQNRVSGTSPDVATQTAGLEYAYFYENHEFGVSGERYDRNVDAALDTDVYRVGAYWTVRFNKPAGSSLGESFASGSSFGAEKQTAPSLKFAKLSLIEDIGPGEKIERAESLLSENGITKATTFSGIKSYEANILNDVVERQRFVVAHKKGSVQKSGLVIDVTDTGSPRSVAQLYERVKEKLVRQFGAPSNAVEQGDFSDKLASDISSGKLIRVVEWETKNGVLRYGIPHRVDGQLRLELQHAKRFNSPRSGQWSMDVN